MSFFGTPSGTHMIIGGTGSGKSMFTGRAVGFSIAMTERIVVGNLPIKWGSAEVVMEKKYGWKGDLEKRFSYEDNVNCLRKFWIHRGFGWVVPDIDKKEWDLGLTTDFTYAYRYVPKAAGEEVPSRECLCRLHRSEVYRMFKEGEVERELVSKLPPVQYVIDECGNIFPQLSKQLIGQSIIYYLSQKRKVGSEGDDIIATAQCATMVDKTFRDLANDWLFLTNWGQRRIGFFRGPKRSTWQLYSPMPRGPHDKAMCSGNFAIEGDDGWGGFYDTAAGVGIKGGLQADKGARPRGLHWAWVIFFGAIIVLAALQIPKLFRIGLAKVVGVRGAMSGAVSPAVVTNLSPVAVAQSFVPAVSVRQKNDEHEKSQTHTDERVVTAVASSPDKRILYVFWQDGDQTTSADREFEGIERRGPHVHAVRWGGKRYVIGGLRNVKSSEASKSVSMIAHE